MNNETKTEPVKKFKRGTIGYEVQKLLKRYGNYGIGIYILAEAASEAAGKPIPLHDAPRYAEMLKDEAQQWQDIQKEIAAADARDAARIAA